MNEVENNNTTGTPIYSDSVNAMNGCLGACLEVVSIMCSILLFMALAPWVGLLLLVWWIIAWVLGLIFPGKEFFPIKRLYRSASDWCRRRLGYSLGDIAFMSLLTVIAGALINGIENLFSRDK